MENLKGPKTEKELMQLGQLVDDSLDLQQVNGIKHAIKLAKKLRKRKLSSVQSATLHYFQANTWANLRLLSKTASDQAWNWEQPEFEKEIFHLRSALKVEDSCKLPKELKTPILTNLANLLSQIGRFVGAIEYRDNVLDTLPSFGMALGNRGIGFVSYAGALYDYGQAKIFLKHAYNDLKTALSSNLHENARRRFDNHRLRIESVLSAEYINKDMDFHSFSLGKSKQEVHYRQWCLENRLFLNPLNDLGPYPIAARDILTTPTITVEISEGPYYPGFFNQMKQEFVSARYLYYEGISAKRPHFSDKNVVLYNTLDYPSYSLAVEKVKTAFRMTYSLFDKVAYFLNKYLELPIKEKRVFFRTFWYEKQDKESGLKQDFQQRQNWPLRGLFWLSKDLFEDKPGFRKSIEPDAQDLHEINNYIKHRYFKLHDDLWHGHEKANDDLFRGLSDTLAFSMYRCDFEAKTLRLIKMVRAALIYLSLAIYCEERQRRKDKDPTGYTIPALLGTYDDKWKV